MASGTITFNADGVLQGKIEWSSTSSGSSENTSSVTAILYARRTDTYGPTSGRSWSGYVNANGAQINISFSYSVSVSSSWVEMARVTTVVQHNDDGTKSINISGTVTGPSGTSLASRTSSGNQTVTLDTIPRYLSFTRHDIRARTTNSISINWATDVARDYTRYSLNGGTWTDAGDTVQSDNRSGYYTVSNLNPNTTYTIRTQCKRIDSGLWTDSNIISVSTFDIAKLSSVPSVNIGASQTISWTNPSGASTNLKLCKTDNNSIIDYGTVTGTSKTVTPTATTIYQLTPNSNTYTARYILTTTQNGRSYTNSKDFVFTVTNSNPEFSNFTYKDINERTSKLTGNNQTLIKGYSNLQATISVANRAVAKNSAIMNTYKVVNGSKSSSKNYSNSEDITLNVNNVDNSSIIMYATDSRGNSTSITQRASLIEYEDLVIKTVTLVRGNNGVGSDVTLSFEGTLWNNSFGAVTNKIVECKYFYRRASNTEWIEGTTQLTYSINKNNFTGNVSIRGDLGANGFTISEAFYIKLQISDELGTKTFEETLGSGSPALAFYKNKVAIGKKYDVNAGGSLQVGGKPILIYDIVNAVNKIIQLKNENNESYYPRTYFPVGYILLSMNNTNPSTWCIGTWELTAQGRTLVGVDTSQTEFNTAGKTGGEKTHTLNTNEMPLHKHDGLRWYASEPITLNGGSGSGYNLRFDGGNNYQYDAITTAESGGGQAHNNLQPYFTCYIWRRVA